MPPDSRNNAAKFRMRAVIMNPVTLQPNADQLDEKQARKKQVSRFVNEGRFKKECYSKKNFGAELSIFTNVPVSFSSTSVRVLSPYKVGRIPLAIGLSHIRISAPTPQRHS